MKFKVGDIIKHNRIGFVFKIVKVDEEDYVLSGLDNPHTGYMDIAVAHNFYTLVDYDFNKDLQTILGE